MQSETAWAMRTKDLLDFKYPKISLAFLDTFLAMEKVSNSDPSDFTKRKHPSLFREGSFFWVKNMSISNLGKAVWKNDGQ